jgi:SAM-dependent methyltransferase
VDRPNTARRLINERFPRSNRYHPDWVVARGAGGANAMWLTEWLIEAMPLERGMRVLDLGCGRAMSSIFLHREYAVDVWATDLWFSVAENARCIRDAGAEGHVFPIRAEAHALPFAPDFFDAIVSIDSFQYYGTDDTYAHYLTRLLKPGGLIGIAGAALTREFDGEVPASLADWWEPIMACLHSAAWWAQHWRRSGILEVLRSDSMADGWQLWLEWQREVAPDNRAEIDALERDRGATLTYARTVARRKPGARVDEPIESIPGHYVRHDLLRR